VVARAPEPSFREVDRDDPPGAGQPASDDGAETDESAPNTARVEPGCTSAVARRADPRRETARERRTLSDASGETLARAISGITVYSANVDVPMKWRIASPSRERRVVPSGRKPRPC
jgi:hypothetical protein